MSYLRDQLLSLSDPLDTTVAALGLSAEANVCAEVAVEKSEYGGGQGDDEELCDISDLRCNKNLFFSVLYHMKFLCASRSYHLPIMVGKSQQQFRDAIRALPDYSWPEISVKTKNSFLAKAENA